MELWSFLFKCRKFGKLEINILLSAAFLYFFLNIKLCHRYTVISRSSP